MAIELFDVGNLKYEREKLKLSKSQMAAALGCSSCVYTTYEQKNKISSKYLDKYSELVGYKSYKLYSSENIEKFMKLNGISKYDFAKSIGIGSSTLFAKLKTKSNFSNMKDKIIEAYGDKPVRIQIIGNSRCYLNFKNEIYVMLAAGDDLTNVTAEIINETDAKYKIWKELEG